MTDSTYTFSFQRPIDFIPQRVVSLVPSMTESLFDLGLGSRLVGVTKYCTRPSEGVARLPKVGGTKNPDIAAICALRPDLVLMNSEENRREDADALGAAGIAVWATEPRTVRESLDLLWQLMDVFEQPQMVPRVRLIEVTYEWISGITINRTPPRVFVPIWRDPWMTANAETYLSDILRVCGGLNVFAERERRYPLAADLGEAEPRTAAERDTRYPRVTLAEIEAAQPDIILLPDEPYPFSAQDANAFASLDCPAAHTGAIFPVDGALLTWHGTRLAYALQDLPRLLGVEAD